MGHSYQDHHAHANAGPGPKPMSRNEATQAGFDYDVHSQTNSQGGLKPILKSSHSSQNFSPHYQPQGGNYDQYGNNLDEIEDDAKRLKHMYPEPGNRESFTKGVMPIKSHLPEGKTSMRGGMSRSMSTGDPFMSSQRSTKTRMN